MNHKSDCGKNKVHGSRKIAVIVAIAAVFMLSTTAFAAGAFNAGWFSAYSEPFEQTSTAEFAQEEGYEPVYIQSFDNGYSYSRGYVVDNQISDAELGAVEEFKSTSFEYEKDGDIVYFSQEHSETELNKYGSIIERYKDTDIYAYSYTNKIVPEDYVPGEAELDAEAKGELIFSYGSDSVSVMEVRSVSWTENGINFMLMQMGGKLSTDELCLMAKEIIDK